MRFKSLSFLAVIAIVMTALAVPVSASFRFEPGEDSPVGDPHPLRRAFRDLSDGALDLPDVDAVVKLNCGSRVGDEGAAVHCEWRAGDDLDVRAWQLWNLQVRPEPGARNLVATLGADALSYVDTDVEVPAAYLYAVLGLNRDGEVIARSRIESVRLAVRDTEVEAMRLTCAAHRVETDRADADSAAVAVGCHWNEVGNDAAVGYVLWKSVDGGERAVLSRVGLETTEIRDPHVATGHRYTYVVTAVDGSGEIVGRSRAAHVAISGHDRPVDRPTDRVPTRGTPPVDVAPIDIAPIDIAPIDIAPIDIAPIDIAPSDVAPTDRIRDHRVRGRQG